jgi:RNA polymerase sigma factor for flagellar operon FliA
MAPIGSDEQLTVGSGRASKKRPSNLLKLVAELGTGVTAKKLKVHRNTITNWVKDARKQRQNGNDDRELNERVSKYSKLVQSIASGISIAHNIPITYEDLYQEGLAELWRALIRYDPTKGASERTFVATRVRGAMVDTLRRFSLYSRIHKEKQVRPKFIQLVDIGSPDDGRSLTHLEQLEVLMKVVSSAAEEPLESDEGLEEILSFFNDRDRRIVEERVLNGLTFIAIGKIFGVCESRICQLYTSALERVREYMGRDAYFQSTVKEMINGQTTHRIAS